MSTTGVTSGSSWQVATLAGTGLIARSGANVRLKNCRVEGWCRSIPRDLVLPRVLAELQSHPSAGEARVRERPEDARTQTCPTSRQDFPRHHCGSGRRLRADRATAENALQQSCYCCTVAWCFRGYLAVSGTKDSVIRNNVRALDEICAQRADPEW